MLRIGGGSQVNSINKARHVLQLTQRVNLLCAFVSNAVYSNRLHFKLTSSHESIKHRANCFAIFPCDIDAFVDHESRDFLATFEVLKPSFLGIFDKPSLRYGFGNFVA